MTSIDQATKLLRKWIVISTSLAASGHPTSCLSAVELMAVLFSKYYTYDMKKPNNLLNDRLVFSKGHAAPLLYALYAAAGAFPLEDLKTLRQFTSPLEGHPTPHFPFTEAATGSLGQGLSVGAGLAFGLKKQKLAHMPHVYVLLGDGELAEGQVWEAANFASHYQLDNLIAIGDINRLGQSDPTMFGHHMLEYKNRFHAFGWETIIIDGHNVDAIDKAYQQALTMNTHKPVIILGETKKGKGVSLWEDKENFHSKQVSGEQLEQALKEIGEVEDKQVFALKVPASFAELPIERKIVNIATTEKIGDLAMTKEVYGKGLVALGKENSLVMALDGDMKNSTTSQDFQKAFPDRFIECFIAEQNMVSVSVGLARLGYIPAISTFAAFFTRAFDQIRMARLSGATLSIAGSYAGVSLGKDGTSQMGLEDMAMIGSLPDTTILYPSDAVSTQKLIGLLPSISGISYLRLARPKVPTLYPDTEEFHVGGLKIIKESDQDILTIVAGGVTVHEALKAYTLLQQEGISVCVIDCYSVKPIDKAQLIKLAAKTKKKCLLTIEDHWIHGGLGDFVLEAVAEEGIPVCKLAVTHVSHSGTEEEVLVDAGIDAIAIISKVKSLLK